MNLLRKYLLGKEIVIMSKSSVHTEDDNGQQEFPMSHTGILLDASNTEIVLGYVNLDNEGTVTEIVQRSNVISIVLRSTIEEMEVLTSGVGNGNIN